MYAKEQAEEKEMHAKELEIQKQEKARSDRLMFLADRIFDSSIPRELRQPFYEEYISMKGNGTAVRFWLLEAEREKKDTTASLTRFPPISSAPSARFVCNSSRREHRGAEGKKIAPKG